MSDLPKGSQQAFVRAGIEHPGFLKARRAAMTGPPYCYPLHHLEMLQSFPVHVTLKQSMRTGEPYLDDSIQQTHSGSIIKQ